MMIFSSKKLFFPQKEDILSPERLYSLWNQFINDILFKKVIVFRRKMHSLCDDNIIFTKVKLTVEGRYILVRMIIFVEK